MRLTIVILALTFWYQLSVAQPGVDTARFEIGGLEVRYYYEKWDAKGELISTDERMEAYAFKVSGWLFLRNKENDTGSVSISTGSGSSTTIRFVFNSDTSRIRYLFMDREESHPRGILVEHLGLFDIPVTLTETSILVDLDSAELAASNISYRFDDGYASGNGDLEHWYRRATGKILPNGRLFFTYLKPQPAAAAQVLKADAVRVSPNPARTAFDVFIPEPGMHHVVLYDKLGRAVHRELAADQTQIDVSDLSPGVYLLVVGSIVQKVVVE